MVFCKCSMVHFRMAEKVRGVTFFTRHWARKLPLLLSTWFTNCLARIPLLLYFVGHEAKVYQHFALALKLNPQCRLPSNLLPCSLHQLFRLLASTPAYSHIAFHVLTIYLWYLIYQYLQYFNILVF